MLHIILDYLDKRSKKFNNFCDILRNYIYNTQADVIIILKKVDDKYVLGTSERGNDTIKLIFNVEKKHCFIKSTIDSNSFRKV
ncbi:hypothetical protein SH1V18_34650 [Vallitalea longa]|uniref:Uncharacterized protein n=1 Tax=Vallitalea longa TaxID=2936439 RepID=A0A9W5YBK0_9FIRM|nr:hypothetical protein [Vallitalea longa]GKX30985.1 hypothetical protein SH1V18_34650 [Vallitalea longa]